MDEVVDEELRVGHEVVDGVAGFRFFPAFVQRTTECFHHSHLPKGRKMKERETTKKREEKVRHMKREKRDKGDPETVCPPADKQSDRQRDTQGQVAAVSLYKVTSNVHPVSFCF